MKKLGTILFYDIQDVNSVVMEFNIKIDFECAYIEIKDSQGTVSLVWSVMDLVTINASIKNRIDKYLPLNSNFNTNVNSIPTFIFVEDGQYVLSLGINNEYKHLQFLDFNKPLFKEMINTIQLAISNFRYVEINNISKDNRVYQEIQKNAQNNGTQPNYQTNSNSGQSFKNAPDIITDKNIPSNSTQSVENPKDILKTKKKKSNLKIIEGQNAIRSKALEDF